MARQLAGAGVLAGLLGGLAMIVVMILVMGAAGMGYATPLNVDIASLTAFEIGLFGWMTLVYFVFFPAPHHLRPDSPVYWFGMQAGMIAGFVTAWPANAWLIRAGLKEAM